MVAGSSPIHSHNGTVPPSEALWTKGSVGQESAPTTSEDAALRTTGAWGDCASYPARRSVYPCARYPTAPVVM
jgi:hypothetical protein